MAIQVQIKGTGQTVEFPDGTPNNVIQQALANFSAKQPQQASPIQQQAPQQPQGTTLADVGEGAAALGLEAVAGVNRGVTGLLDFFTIDQINNVRTLMGEDAIPTLQQALAGPSGQFAEGTIAEGLPADIAAGAGEMAVAGLTGQGLIQQGAKQLAPLAASTGARVLRQAAEPTAAGAAALGGLSGAGEEAGRDVGGEAGAVIGALSAPLAGVAAAKSAAPIAKGVKNLGSRILEKFGRESNLIEPETMLPTPALQRALDKRGVQFGSFVDDIEAMPAVIGKGNPDQVVDRILRRKLIENSTDDVTATIRLEGNSIVPDALGEEAVKQGIKPGNVAAMKGFNSSTKNEAMKMLNMNRQILADSSKADEFRPANIVGDNVMRQFNFVNGKASSLRNELDQIAKKPSFDSGTLSGPGVVTGLKGQSINTGKIEDAVIDGLEKLRINIPEDVLQDTRKLSTFLKGRDAFTGSVISKNPNSKKIIKDAVDLLAEPGKADAERAHNLKRQLDDLIDFNKKAKGGITESGRNFAKTLRATLNESIREVNPRYAQVNDELSKSIETMNNFQRVLGPSIDVFDRGASAAVGQDLRGLLSNRKTRVKLENAVNALDETAKSLGGNFDVNVRGLVRMANILDDRFGAVADNSLKGEFTSALAQAARGEVDAMDIATKKLAETAEGLRGINDANALNSIQRILKR